MNRKLQKETPEIWEEIFKNAHNDSDFMRQVVIKHKSFPELGCSQRGVTIGAAIYVGYCLALNMDYLPNDYSPSEGFGAAFQKTILWK